MMINGPIVTIEIPEGLKSHNYDTWRTKIAQLETTRPKLHNHNIGGSQLFN